MDEVPVPAHHDQLVAVDVVEAVPAGATWRDLVPGDGARLIDHRMARRLDTKAVVHLPVVHEERRVEAPDALEHAAAEEPAAADDVVARHGLVGVEVAVAHG